jgi:hypothetical protein
MIGFATLLVVVGGALVWSRELRDTLLYEIAPRYARDANFVRLARGPESVYILGTIHGRHLSTSEYSLAHLKAVIAHLRADLLLVEARPRELAQGRWGDGPIEMPYAALTARSRGLRVDGIDWWDSGAPARARRTDDVRDDKIFHNMMERLPGRGTALVLVGYSHVPELAARLASAGFAEQPITAEQKSRLFALLDEPFAYPPGMSAAIRRRIVDAKAMARSSPHLAGAARAVIDARVRYLEEIKRVGEYPCAPSTADSPASEIPAPPPGEIASIASLRTEFLSRAGRVGLVLDFTPEVREWTRPSLISWRQEARAVAIPRWDELSPAQRTLTSVIEHHSNSGGRGLAVRHGAIGAQTRDARQRSIPTKRGHAGLCCGGYSFSRG